MVGDTQARPPLRALPFLGKRSTSAGTAAGRVLLCARGSVVTEGARAGGHDWRRTRIGRFSPHFMERPGIIRACRRGVLLL